MSKELIIYTNLITARHQYIFDLLFNGIYKIKYDLTDDKSFYLQSEGYKLNYSANRLDNNEFFVEENGLLKQKGVYELDIKVDKSSVIPVFFNSNHNESYYFDVFAASFYLVTRYEEYLPHLKDKYNRYKAEQSLAYRNNFLNIPIVNMWMKDFISDISIRFTDLNITYPNFKFSSTIDIDSAYLYKSKGFVRSIAFLLKTLYNLDLKSFKIAIKVIANKIKDPFDTYLKQLEIQKKYNLDVKYFILLADYGLNDKSISYNNKNFQILIKHLADFADLGIHPSFGSNYNKNKLFTEIKRLEEIQKREVTFSRQHFFQLSLPNTYIKLIEAGITDDFTMGYSSHLGYRAGIADSFLFYNLDAEQILPIRIHPFAIVDDILNYNMNLKPEDVMNHVCEIIDQTRNVNGKLISIWHSDTFSDFGNWKGWANVYEDIVKYIKK